MATYNVELRQRVGSTFGDIIYLKGNWSNIDNKPSTFTPTAHTHGNVTNDGKIGSTAGLLIKTGTAGLLEALAAGNSGQFLGHDGTWKDLPAIVEESFNTNTVLTHDLTYVSNGDFKTNLKTIDEDKLIFVQFPTTTSTSTLRVSVNNGTTYYNVVKNGNTMRASVVSGQLVRLQVDGTKFVADIQGDVEIVEEYSDAIESTFGQFNPHDGGMPIVREVQGRTIPALENLVENGDFSDGTTGWSVSNSLLSVISNNLLITGSGSGSFPSSIPTHTTNLIVGNIYYVKSRIRTLSALTLSMRLWAGVVSNNIQISLPIQNQWYEISEGVIADGISALVQHRYGSSTDANGSVMEVDYIMYFDLTASHGVTSTSGTAYDNAVADIEAMLALNGGYITTTPTTHLENSEFKSVGKNLFDGEWFQGYRFYNSQSENAISIDNKIKGVLGQTYKFSYETIKGGSVVKYDTYDINGVTVRKNLNGNTVTLASNEYYFDFFVYNGNGITSGDITKPMVEQSTVTTTYAPYNTETQKFNHGALRSTIDKTVYDKIRYDNGQYVLDVYIDESDNTALATPLLAQSTIDVDGTLIQESVTTLEQLQNIPTTYDVEFSMNTEQTTKTLVQRDKIQQEEIDSLEGRVDTLETHQATYELVDVLAVNDTFLMSEIGGNWIHVKMINGTHISSAMIEKSFFVSGDDITLLIEVSPAVTGTLTNASGTVTFTSSSATATCRVTSMYLKDMND